MTRQYIICPKFIRQSKSLFWILLSLWQFIVCSCHLKPRYRNFKKKTTLSYKQVRNNNAINSNQPLLINIRINEPRLRTLFQPPTTITINGKARLKGVGACAPTIKLKVKKCVCRKSNVCQFIGYTAASVHPYFSRFKLFSYAIQYISRLFMDLYSN